MLEPETFKGTNEEFLVGDFPYDVMSHETKEGLRNRIWNVRNGDLQRVLDRFPTDEDITDQCAHWMHAVVGKHFFPDANHRTAVALLRRLLLENGIEPGDWPVDRTERAIEASHRVRGELPPVRMDMLYARDQLFSVWRRYFEDVLTADRGEG